MNSAGFGRCGSVAVQVRFSAVYCGSVRFVWLGAVHAVHAVGLRLGAVVVLVSPKKIIPKNHQLIRPKSV